MGRGRARKRERLEPENIVLLLCLVAAVEVWNKTNSWPLTWLAFLSPLVLILVVKGIR